MIRSLPSSKTYLTGYRLLTLFYFRFLFAPLVVAMILAFNDSMFPSLSWKGFALDWFFGKRSGKLGIFYDKMNLRAIATSFKVTISVAILSTIVGTMAAFLFEQEDFKFKDALYFLMIAPLVIPGVILGISILLFSTTVGLFLENTFGIDIKILRPGFWLIVFGQFSFLTTIVTMVISARLRKFDRTVEEAAIAFLMSFENLNTTTFLISSQPTLPIILYQQVRDGSTPVINAISFILIVSASIITVANFYYRNKEKNWLDERLK